MRKREVQLLLVILIGLTAILLGDHLLSGVAGEGSARAKRAVAATFRAAPAREGSGLPNEAKSADSLNARLESRSITNQKSPITNPLVQNPKSKIQNSYGRLPLSFEANQGQTDPQVKFLTRGGGYTIFLTADEAVLALRKSQPSQPGMTRFGKFGPPGRLKPFGPVDPRAGRWPSLASDWKSLWPSLIPDPVEAALRGHGEINSPLHGQPDSPLQVVRMRLMGGNAKARVVGLDELPGRSNYFIGNDPKKWRTNVPSYAKVKYEGVYPGVDLVYYGNQGQLEYDFAVAPGADPNQIKLSFAGADGMLVDAASGDLMVKVGDDELRFQKPAIYQPAVAAVYDRRLDSSTNQAPVAAVYDRRRRSQSAPTAELESTFVQASNNEVAFRVAGYDHKRALVIDPVLSYSTYLGGSSGDGASAIAVDRAGNAYATGSTESSDFPTVNPFQATNKAAATTGDSTAFVAKLNLTGSALVYSTYLGGSNNDGGFGIAVDAAGNAYVTGFTSSTDFPTVNPVQATNKANIYGTAFVAKLNSTGSALVYSTYLGGGGNEDVYGGGIAADSSGNAYVTGSTTSTDFPTVNPIQATNNATPTTRDPTAFVAKLNPAGSALVYSTYLGGSSYDEGFGIAVDAAGNAYVTGSTDSTDFPTVNPFQATNNAAATTGDATAFVAKLNAAGSALVFSTYLGGSSWDCGSGIAVDSSGNAYVAGYTDSTDFPTVNPIQATNKAAAASPGDRNALTAFVAKLNPAGSALVYSTYLGGSSWDYGSGIAVDSSGNAYVAGYTDSTDFPTVNPIQATNKAAAASPDDPTAFVAKLNPAGSALVYSTYMGGSFEDFGTGIAVDSSGNAYVTGQTTSTDFPTVNPFQANYQGNGDAFVAKISAAPAVTLSTNSLSFAGQIVSTTSAEQSVTLTNAGDGLLSITTITVSGDFALATTADSCPYSGGSVASQANCTIDVTFTPTVIGPFTGTLTITDKAANSPQTIALSGTGQDFTLAAASGSSTSATVAPGQPATYTLSATGEGGFNQSVNFSCTGAPSEATCTVSPSPLTPGSSATNITVSVTTTAPSVSAPRSRPLPPIPPLSPGLRGLLMLALVLAAMAWSFGRRKQPGVSRWRSTLVPLASALLLTLALAGCGGGGSSVSMPPPNPGTPAGTYKLTVTGTAGSGSATLSHSVTLTLTVS